jgi:hypothetical protein
MRTLLIACVLLGAACPTAHAMEAPPDDARIEEQVRAVVLDMASRWGSGRRHTIVGDLWDLGDSRVMYLAGEQPDWFVGVSAIEAYLAVRPNAPPSVSRYEADMIRVRTLSDGVALATWNLDYQFQRGTMQPMRERLRASAILRSTPAGWKFCYYAESPKSAMTYLRELYEAIVTPDFRKKAADASRAH